MNTSSASGQGQPAPADDAQVAAWLAEEYGTIFTTPADGGDLAIEEVLDDAARALADHHATHPARAMTIWSYPDRPDNVILTIGEAGTGHLAVLTVERRSFGASMQEALAELLRAARTGAALLAASAEGTAPPPGRVIPESGTVLTYDPAAVAEGSLDCAVHDLFSRRASQLNNDGPLTQMAYLISELGPAGAQQELTTGC